MGPSIWMSVLNAGSPYWIRSRSRVRGPQWTSRVRPWALSMSCRKRRSARGDNDVVPVTTALRYAGWSGPPTGSVSTSGETASMSIRPNSAMAASRRVSRESPTFEPSAITTGVSRSRRTRTDTSVNGWPTGACGLWTTTSTASTSGRARTLRAIRSARDSMRSRGSPSIRDTTSPATSA